MGSVMEVCEMQNKLIKLPNSCFGWNSEGLVLNYFHSVGTFVHNRKARSNKRCWNIKDVSQVSSWSIKDLLYCVSIILLHTILIMNAFYSL